MGSESRSSTTEVESSRRTNWASNLFISLLFEVLGPAGHGPSSSHTMAPHRAAYAAYRLLGGQPDSAHVTLINSFATTGKGHRTHVAIAAGLCGMSPDSENRQFADAIEIARERGLEIQFHPATEPAMHDNTIVFVLQRGNRILEMTIESTGGGRFRVPICKLNGVDHALAPEVAPHSFEEAGEAFIGRLPMLHEAAEISPLRFCKLAELCTKRNLDPAEFALLWETYIQINRGGLKSPVEVKREARRILSVMSNAVEQGIARPQHTNVTDGDAGYLMARRPSVLGPLALAFTGGLAGQEYNAGMGFVQAAPTCGASSALPATIHFARKMLHPSEEDLVNALLVAGLAGQVAFANGPVSGAGAGCGGETGVAAIMAAAFMVFLLGGGWEEIDAAAALVGQNYIGLDCSPSFGFVEWPCIFRNGFAAMNAIAAAEFVLSGYRVPNTLDGTLMRIFAVGSHLHELLREREDGPHCSSFVRLRGYKECGCSSRAFSV